MDQKQFAALRALAREHRDQAIAQARSDYELSLVQIAELESRIGGKAKRQRAISACVDRCVPRDKPFTVESIMTALEALDSSRVWPIGTVRRQITNLRAKGLVARIARHTSTKGAVYIRCNGKPAPTINDRNLISVLREVVTKPMTTAEIVAAVRAAGWETTMIPEHFRTHVRNRLGKAGYREVRGRWVRA